MTNEVHLDGEEMVEVLTHLISNNQYIQNEQGLTPVASEIRGESGLGKTSIAEQMAKALDLHFIKKNLAQLEELGDLVGFPLRQFEMIVPSGKTKKNAQGQDVAIGVRKWVDENATESYLKLGARFTGKNQTSHCPPEWIAGIEGDKGGILLIDDWNRADLRFVQAIMELLDRQEYYSWKLPKNWHIILTANPDDGNYLVTSIDDAHSTRMTTINLKWSAPVWARWAERNRIDTRCINFILMYPEIITPRVNPRALTTFFKSIYSIPDFEEPKSLALIRKLAEGSIGAEAGTMFALFIGNRFDKMITPEDFLVNLSWEEGRKQLINAVQGKGFGEADSNDGNQYRNDIASVLMSRILNYTLHYAETNPITPEMIEKFYQLVVNPDILTKDITYVLMKKLVSSAHKQKFAKLAAYREVQEVVLA